MKEIVRVAAIAIAISGVTTLGEAIAPALGPTVHTRTAAAHAIGNAGITTGRRAAV